MAKQMLSVLPVGTALSTNYEDLEAGRMSYVGRKKVLDEAGNVIGFEPIGAPVSIPMRGEYLLELRHGMLEPADEATAKIAGVPFKAPEAAATPLKSSK